MKRIGILTLLLLSAALLLTGCGSKTASTEATTAPAAAATAEPTSQDSSSASAQAQAEALPAESDALSIPLDSLSSQPTFVDWKQDGQTMQLIALVNDANEVRVAYNTCQSCAGSPYAYFEYANGILTCQNCGNTFGLDSVGAVTGGCNPMPVGEASIEGDALVIPASELSSVAPAFENWKNF